MSISFNYVITLASNICSAEKTKMPSCSKSKYAALSLICDLIKCKIEIVALTVEW